MMAVDITRDINLVATALKTGELAIVPTDTVYGVAASLEHSRAIEQLYVAKSRPESKPIPILVDSVETAGRLAQISSSIAVQLFEAFWPGGLTVVLPGADSVPERCRAASGTVGLRMPDHPLLLELLARCSGALAVTSANLSGDTETTTASAATAALADRVAIALDGGDAPGGLPSTVVAVKGDSLAILRAGAIPEAVIRHQLQGR